MQDQIYPDCGYDSGRIRLTNKIAIDFKIPLIPSVESLLVIFLTSS
jgi:hypothetical protein